MNLATRCTTCGTIFRVVQDQLRVSEGWVRCGRCAEVFDAREQLFDLERDSPPPWPPLSAPAEPAPVERRPPPPPQAPVAAPPAFQPSSFQPSSYPGDFAPSRPAPEPSPPAPVFAPEPPAHHQPPRDSGWMVADDGALNPFAPPRRVPEEEPMDDVVDARFQASRFDPPAPATRREPFLESPAAPDPREHLPEPKGLRFEEDGLPPPMMEDDRPDVTLALSPATAAQLRANEPPSPQEPSLEPSSSMMAADEDTIAEGKRAAKAAKSAKTKAKKASRESKDSKDTKGAKTDKAGRPGRSWNPFRRKSAAHVSGDSPETTMTVLAAESELMAARAAMADAASAQGSPSVMPDQLPSFMRQAEAARRWNRPGVRIALGSATTVLALGLMGQLLWHAREAIAAQYPAAKPMLVSVAQALGQEIKPWQHIEALSVESSSLNPAGAGNHYRFSISLRNRSSWDVAQPWVDLSLTDATGTLVVRRMLSPTEMQAGRAALPSGADQQLQLVFDSGTQKISGYSVELFYP